MAVKLRAAIYVRVANDENAVQRLADQEERIRQWADHNACEVVQVFADIGSGVSETRPGLLALRSAALAGQLDVVIITEWTRLFRDVTQLARCCRQLKGEWDVDVIPVFQRGGEA
jgi:DNA invertase Pin-like site-specific DNA recombinase